MAPAARKPTRSGCRVPGQARGGAAGELRGRGRRSGPDSRAPDRRPRDQGGELAPRAGEDSARATPGRLRWPGLWPREVSPRTLGLPAADAAAQHRGRRRSGSPPRGSHLRDSSRSSRRARRRGREAGPEVRREAWRPWAGFAAASSTRGPRDTLRLCPTTQETFRPGGENTKTNGRQAPVPARRSPGPLQPARCQPERLAQPSADLCAHRLRTYSVGKPQGVQPPLLLPLPPPPQLTLPAPAAIVTLTETYPVHHHGNAHPSRALLLLSRAVGRRVTWSTPW